MKMLLEANKTVIMYGIGSLVAAIAIMLLTLNQMKNTEMDNAHAKSQGDMQIINESRKGIKISKSSMADNIKRWKEEAKARKEG